ncbi:MARVEL domain-containing protein 3 [Ambystoma mexicanum]|uniref:MARVEL domain-containing protein 3 n=1 Tax=Ambystoma mexicanum TaxID=8296 RepID=UPI0037E7BBD3
MSDADDWYRLEPNHFSKDEEHRAPRRDRDKREDPRHQNRRNERQGHEDRSRTGPSHGNNHYSTERSMQDMNLYSPDQEREREHRPRNEVVSREDRRRQQRHLENRSLDREDRGNHKEANQDRHRGYPSQPHKYLEDRPPHREGRSRDRVELSHSREEGSRDKYWEDGSRDKHRDKNPPRERDQSWDVRAQSFPRDVKEVDSPLQSNYYKKDDLSLRYGPPPQTLTFDEREYYESEPEGGILECNKCRYLCTGRGVLQILEVVLCALVLICVVSSYFVLSGLSSSFASGGGGGGLGSMNFPFEGQELQQVRQLDQQFTVMRSPLVYGGLAFSVLMAGLTLGVLAAGSKHLQDLSRKWLLFEAAFSLLASLGCGAAVSVFLHFALQMNGTDVCKKRARLYARNGLTWMNCDLAGTDGAAATFAILLIIFYMASLVLAIRSFREQSRGADYPEGFSAHTETGFPRDVISPKCQG